MKNMGIFSLDWLGLGGAFVLNDYQTVVTESMWWLETPVTQLLKTEEIGITISKAVHSETEVIPKRDIGVLLGRGDKCWVALNGKWLLFYFPCFAQKHFSMSSCPSK